MIPEEMKIYNLHSKVYVCRTAMNCPGLLHTSYAIWFSQNSWSSPTHSMRQYIYYAYSLNFILLHVPSSTCYDACCTSSCCCNCFDEVRPVVSVYSGPIEKEVCTLRFCTRNVMTVPSEFYFQYCHYIF